MLKKAQAGLSIVFEHYTESRKPRRRPLLAVILSVSFAVHLAVAVALIIAGMWPIARLAPPTRALVIDIGPQMARVGEPKPMERMKPVPRPADRTKKRKVLAQPADSADEREPADEVEYVAYDDVAIGPASDGDLGATGFASATGVAFGDGLSFIEVDHIEPLVKPPDPEKVYHVAPTILEGRRIAGNAWILPPESVRVHMYRNRIERIVGLVKLCIDTAGRVKTLQVTRSIGYKAYDTKLLREMRHWRYRPYQIGGRPVPVCTSVKFIYKMLDR